MRKVYVAVASLSVFAGTCDGQQGRQGDGCTIVTAEDGTRTLACEDGTAAVIADGDDGQDATPCTVVENADGSKTVTCGASTITIEDGEDGDDGAACTVADNGDGRKTITCADGTEVTVRDGEGGIKLAILSLHGKDFLQSDGSFAADNANPKFFVTPTIISATADANGLVTVEFSLADLTNAAVVGLYSEYAIKPRFTIAKLVGTSASNDWVPYLYGTAKTAGTGAWPMSDDATVYYQPTYENNGTLTDNGDGSYAYVFATSIANAYQGETQIEYERDLTHRVSVSMGGSAGPTGSAAYDFVPDGSAVTETRNIVQTATCQECHGWEFRGHGGDRTTTENCVTCHTAGNIDPQSGNTVDFKVMIHKIHSGGELEGIAGDDGAVWDDPTTDTNESADNGDYSIWGYQNTQYTWWKAGFPAIIENCEKCHSGTGEDVDNWKTPNQQACGSCHPSASWTQGAADRSEHNGLPDNSSVCLGCHQEGGNGGGVEEAHDWVASWAEGDLRKVPEFLVELNVSTPANGSYFVRGESPVLTLKLRDNEVDGNPYISDAGLFTTKDSSAEGCPEANGTAGNCPSRDNRLTVSSVYVHGPRARRMPVLTTGARARLVAKMAPNSATCAGTYDISGSSRQLIVRFDGGERLRTNDLNVSASGYVDAVIALTVPTSGTDYTTYFTDANRTKCASPQQIVDWLNKSTTSANKKFQQRGIASLDTNVTTGVPAVQVRSRNLGKVHSVEFLNTNPATGAAITYNIATTIFDSNGTTDPSKWLGTASGSNAFTDATDPKVERGTDYVRYALDPVDDLEAGTYVAYAEIADRGNLSDTDYKTPSVGIVRFQVKQANEEMPVARNCNSCHQDAASGSEQVGENAFKGFVLDFRRHYKIFDDYALDRCGNCHDYQPAVDSTVPGEWGSGKPIARRVHAVHFGSELNFPLTAVWYGNGDPVKGRNWEIKFPQDVRNCEACHTDETSGTWATSANRLACGGCHESDEAWGHIMSMVDDPTPANPWSGDEREACAACHE